MDMAEGNRTMAAVLLRTALLATVLAVIAGFLGMHMLAGGHGLHSPAAHSAAAAAAGAVEASGTTASDHHHGPADHQRPPAPPSCVCEGACGEAHAAHVSCTPAPSSTFPAVPAAATTALAARPSTAPPKVRVAAYSYRPATPTPTELSISRT